MVCDPHDIDRILHENFFSKQSVALYLIALPFTMVGQLSWFLIPMMGLVAFTLFGIEGIGSEIGKFFLRLRFCMDVKIERTTRSMY